MLLLALLASVIGTNIYSVVQKRQTPKDFEKLKDIVKQTELMEIVDRDPKLKEHFKNIGLL